MLPQDYHTAEKLLPVQRAWLGLFGCLFAVLSFLPVLV
jgi:hypothetical protein